MEDLPDVTATAVMPVIRSSPGVLGLCGVPLGMYVAWVQGLALDCDCLCAVRAHTRRRQMRERGRMFPFLSTQPLDNTPASGCSPPTFPSTPLTACSCHRVPHHRRPVPVAACRAVFAAAPVPSPSLHAAPSPSPHAAPFPPRAPYRPRRRPRTRPLPAARIPGPRIVPVDPCHCGRLPNVSAASAR